MEILMLKYSFEKKPAFFRSTLDNSAFFEAEALDTEIVLESLEAGVCIDAELEKLLEAPKN